MAKKSDKKAAAAKPKGATQPVYTVMAFVTLVAIALGCTLLYLDFDEYGKETAPKEKVPALPKLGDGGLSSPAGTPAPAPAPGPAGPAGPMPMTPPPGT